MQPWNLILTIQMLLGASLASFLLVGKTGFKQTRLYLLFAMTLCLNFQLFIYTAPVFLFLLVAFKNGRITPPLFWMNAGLGIVSIISILRLIFPTPHFMLINNLVSFSVLLVAGTLCMKKYRDYALAITLISFTLFWSSYGNSWHPIHANLSMPYACLSLLIFLYLHVVNTKFKGSVVHIIYKHMTRRKFKRYHREKRVLVE